MPSMRRRAPSGNGFTKSTQIKGDGEAHPLLSPDDEFADFETWDMGNLDLSEKKTPEMLPHEYARSGLKLGLELEAKLGANPSSSAWSAQATPIPA